MSDAAGRIAELERALAALAESYRSSAPGSELRRRIAEWAERALASARPMLARAAERAAADVTELELDRAFASAEPDLDQMITPDSAVEEALRADSVQDEAGPLATGAFATRTMAELLERQGDRRGAARIRAAIAEPRAPAPGPRNRTAALTALEGWLDSLRRLQP